MPINGVITPKIWLPKKLPKAIFWVTSPKWVTFFSETQKKKPVLSRFSTFWFERGASFQSAWTPILVVFVQAIIANSVATSTCFSKFFIYGVTSFLASLFDSIVRNEKANGN